MRTVHRLTMTGLLLVLGTALPLAAQDVPEQQDVVAQLRGKGALTDEDMTALRNWVGQRVRMVSTGSRADAGLAAKDLRESYKGTPAYQQAYVTVCTEVIGAAYKQAKRDAAARLIAVLNTLKALPTYPMLIEALGDQRVPVRAAAAVGLRNLRPKLASTGGNAFTETIAALRDAGKREESHAALQLIYSALDYSGSSPDPKASGTALLELLEARGAQYGARNVKAEGADCVGLQLAGRLAGQLDDGERRRLAITAARMLHYGVTRYTGELYKIDDKTSSPVQVALRNRIELFIRAAEELLSKLTEPPRAEDFQTVTAEMQDREQKEKSTYMKIAMNEWATVLRERFQLDLQIDVTPEETAPEEP